MGHCYTHLSAGEREETSRGRAVSFLSAGRPATRFAVRQSPRARPLRRTFDCAAHGTPIACFLYPIAEFLNVAPQEHLSLFFNGLRQDASMR